MEHQISHKKHEDKINLHKPETHKTTEMLGTEDYPIRQDKEVTTVRGEGDNYGEFSKVETESVGDKGPYFHEKVVTSYIHTSYDSSKHHSDS